MLSYHGCHRLIVVCLSHDLLNSIKTINNRLLRHVHHNMFSFYVIDCFNLLVERLIRK